MEGSGRKWLPTSEEEASKQTNHAHTMNDVCVLPQHCFGNAFLLSHHVGGIVMQPSLSNRQIQSENKHGYK